MRLGVLDVGSTTVHLLVVDARPGARPAPVHSEKVALRLAERLDDAGRLPEPTVDALADAVAAARRSAARSRVNELLAFATSAVREAANATAVLDRVHEQAGVRLEVLSGAAEARLTFLAVRRWFGWSAGRLLVLDIGGGSLELAAGDDEVPDIALSLPLGAGRLTRQLLPGDPPDPAQFDALTGYVEEVLADPADRLRDRGWDGAVGTSKTMRTLARLAAVVPPPAGSPASRVAPGVRGPQPPAAGAATPGVLGPADLHRVLDSIRGAPAAALARLDGVSASRAPTLLAGAVVAAAALRRLGLAEVRICPWALREGVIFRRLDALTVRS